jgi:hypothetical protein
MSGVAARTSAGGVSTFGGAAAATARSIEALTSAGVDKNLAASAAGLAAGTSDAILRQRNIDIPSIVQSAQMMEKFGLKPGTVAGEAASKLQAPQAEALLKVLQNPSTSTDQKQKAIDEAGQGLWLKGDDKDAAQKIKDLSKINLKKVYAEKYQAFGWSKDDYNLMMKNIDKPDSLSGTEKSRVESFTRAADQALRGFTESHTAYSAYGDVGKRAREKNPSKYTGPVNPNDAGFSMDSAGAQGDITQYAAGLKDMNQNLAGIIKTMENEAANLDPKKFAEIVNGSAGTLDQSVARLAKTVDALNLKLQGDNKGSSAITTAITTDLNSNVNQNQNKQGGVTPSAGKTSGR